MRISSNKNHKMWMVFGAVTQKQNADVNDVDTTWIYTMRLIQVKITTAYMFPPSLPLPVFTALNPTVFTLQNTQYLLLYTVIRV